MPQQNWYWQNNRRAPTGDDYVLLGNRLASDPGGQANTAAAPSTSFTTFLSSTQTSNAVAVNGVIVAVDASSASITVDAVASPQIGDKFGVHIQNLGAATTVTVTGNGSQIQQPLTFGSYGATADVTLKGATFVWVYANPDATTARWMLSGDAGNANSSLYFSASEVTPAQSPYQASVGEWVRVDPSTAAEEEELVIRTPPNPQAGHWFGIKETGGSSNIFTVDTNDGTISVENPAVIPAQVAQSIVTGGTGSVARWDYDPATNTWWITQRFRREVNTAAAVFKGTSSNGDIPVGNIDVAYTVERIARTGTGVYNIYFDVPLPSGTVVVTPCEVFSQNLPADTTGEGAHIGTTFGAENVAHVTVNFGYRNKNGQWTDFDFLTEPDRLSVRVNAVGMV